MRAFFEFVELGIGEPREAVRVFIRATRHGGLLIALHRAGLFKHAADALIRKRAQALGSESVRMTRDPFSADIVALLDVKKYRDEHYWIQH